MLTLYPIWIGDIYIYIYIYQEQCVIPSKFFKRNKIRFRVFLVLDRLPKQD